MGHARPRWATSAALILLALAGTLALACSVPGPPTREGRVVRVVDGDTIEVRYGGQVHKVRYIGIDTPESVDPRRPVEELGKEAAAKNKELVQGKRVRLEKDVSQADKYGRLLRYVYVDDVMINAELIRLGYARAVAYPPDVMHAELFRQLEREARENKRGLWAEAGSPEGAATPLWRATAEPTGTSSGRTHALAPTSFAGEDETLSLDDATAGCQGESFALNGFAEEDEMWTP